MSIKKQIESSLDNFPSMTLTQDLYVRNFTAILVDLVVLGLLNEYWAKVEINSFAIALMVAVLLQVHATALGLFHGIFAFLVMVFAMILAEMLVRIIFFKLGRLQRKQ